jgi:hypothetical protein
MIASRVGIQRRHPNAQHRRNQAALASIEGAAKFVRSLETLFILLAAAFQAPPFLPMTIDDTRASCTMN